MPRYKVLTPIDIDNKRVEPGKLVELDEDVALPLQAVNAIEFAPTKAQAKSDAAE